MIFLSPSPLFPPPLLYEGAPPPTHPFLPHCSSIPLCWGTKPPQDQGPPLPLMSDKAIPQCMLWFCHDNINMSTSTRL